MHKYLDTKTYAHKAHCLVTREGPAPQAITSDSICSNILISLYSDTVTIFTLYITLLYSACCHHNVLTFLMEIVDHVME